MPDSQGYRDIIERKLDIGDVFPGAITGDEVDLRIANSEGRIKFWIVACVCTNLVLAAPTVFYMGRMAQSVEEMSSSVKELQASQDGSKDWVRDRMIWEARIEALLRERGMQVK